MPRVLVQPESRGVLPLPGARGCHHGCGAVPIQRAVAASLTRVRLCLYMYDSPPLARRSSRCGVLVCAVRTLSLGHTEISNDPTKQSTRSNSKHHVGAWLGRWVHGVQGACEGSDVYGREIDPEMEYV